MNAVGECDSGVSPRPLEPGKSRPQHFQSSKASVRDRFAHPERSRIEAKNVADLQDQPRLLRQYRQFFCLARYERNWFFHKHVSSHSEQITTGLEVRLCW